MHNVREITAHRPHAFLLDARMTALEGARFLRKHHIGGAPVVDGGRVVGFCSERDLTYRVLAEKRDASETPLAEVMSRDVISADLDDGVDDCERRMRKAHVRHLPIVADGEVVACISLRDLLKSELDESEFEREWLTRYIHGDA